MLSAPHAEHYLQALTLRLVLSVICYVSSLKVMAKVMAEIMAEVMADLFTMMESHKQKWQIDQYSIAQATLNTVFLDLARRPVRVPRWHKKTTTCLSLPTQQWTKDRMGTKTLDNPKGSLLPTPRSSFKPSANNSRKSSAVAEDERTKYFASEKK